MSCRKRRFTSRRERRRQQAKQQTRSQEECAAHRRQNTGNGPPVNWHLMATMSRSAGATPECG
jgi:hypothetical protein